MTKTLGEKAEAAFRHWQEKHSACLMTNWTVTNKEMSYEDFCLKRYTGRLTFALRENN